MSYISDALRKARKADSQDQERVKKTIWSSLMDAVSSRSQKTDAWQKRYTAIGLSIAVFYTVGIIAVMYWSDVKSAWRSVRLGSQRVVVKPVGGFDQPHPIQGETSQTTAERSPQSSPETAGVQLVEAPQSDSESAPEAEPAASQMPGDPKKLYARALEKQRAGAFEEAKDLYRAVIQKEPHNVKALNNLGVVYMKMKRYRWALIRLKEAVRIRPDYADAHYNLACLYAQLNHPSESLQYLRKAVALNPAARDWAAQDSDFKGLENLAEYKDILGAQDH